MNNPGHDYDIANLRVPPHSIEAEQSVIGGLLRDNTAFDRIGGKLLARDFYRTDHREIFTTIVRLLSSNKPADVITVFEQLQLMGKAEDVGGMPYLNSMAQNTPSAANIGRYAEIVISRSILRRLITAANEICDSAYRPQQADDAMGVLGQAEAKILAIGEERSRGDAGAVPLQPLLTKVVERIDELYSREDQSEITGIPSGFTDLDQMTSGLQPGDMVVVAGRPSMGKTAFAVNIGEHVAIEAGLPVLIFSMEMGAEQLALRILGSVGQLDQQRMRKGKLLDEDWPRLTHGIQKLNDVPIYIDETPSLSPLEMRARARREARLHGKFGLIVVDYIQLMVANGDGQSRPENRANEVAEISRSLKALAKEMGCPVIALSQLNRTLESRPNKRPIMSDLRESGAIEQDADVIIFLYRDEVYYPDSEDKGTAEIIIGKQRNGPTGTVRLTWVGASTKFRNYQPLSYN